MTQARRVDSTPAQPIVAGNVTREERQTMSELGERLIEPIDWPWVIANLKYYGWQVASKAVIGPIYLTVVSEGFRVIFPTLAVLVYGTEEYGIDRAMLFAGILLIAVWMLWERALLMWLNDDSEYERSAWNPENHRNLIMFVAVVLLGGDGALFYLGVASLGWGGGISGSAVLGTVVYMGLIIFVSYVAISLKRKIYDIERGGGS